MIRPYEDTDLKELLDVWYASTSVAHSFMDTAFLEKEKKNVRDVYIPNTKTWVYPNGYGLDGFISMIDNEVGAIFVRPEKQGKGIGKVLMDFVSQFHKTLEVEVFKENKIGRGFYDAYGFKKMKEYVHDETQQIVFRMKYVR